MLFSMMLYTGPVSLQPLQQTLLCLHEGIVVMAVALHACILNHLQ